MTAALHRLADIVEDQFRNLAGVTVMHVGTDLYVYLDDATSQVVEDVARSHFRGEEPELDYAGAGMVRTSWPTVVYGRQVIFTDTEPISEYLHRVEDIRGLTPAELAEYVYDDTGVENCG